MERPCRASQTSITEIEECKLDSEDQEMQIWDEGVRIFRLCGGEWKCETGSSEAEEYPVPRTKKQVRGFTGYYRRFIKEYATIALPLTDVTKKSLPDRVEWTPECEAAFVSLKRALCQAPVLANPDFRREFILQTDASDRGVGAVLSQIGGDGQERPISYFSRKLLPREVRYSTVEKECLAIKLGV